LSLLVVTGIVLYYFNAPPAGMRDSRVAILEGMTPIQTGQMLESDNLVKNGRFFSLLFRIHPGALLKRGSYRITAGSTTLEIMKQLSGGRVILQKVTLPEGFNLYQVAERLDKQSIIPESEFHSLVRDRQFITSLGLEAPTLEGYLFPDTYRFASGSEPEKVIRVLVRAMKKVLDREGVPADPGERHRLLTLASLVEEEAHVPGERPVIASVFINRLERGMRMDCDPTVRYAVRRFTGPIRKSDLESSSPYNTYRRRGLPPGPISSPGRSSIRAVLHPADTDYLYFVAREDGSHYFSRTLSEHNRAVQFYQRGVDNGFVDNQQRYR
jgi:UPF0755 protein